MSEETSGTEETFFNTLAKDTKKIGRFAALLIILGVAGGISVTVAVSTPEKTDAILDGWMELAKIAVMFYFMVTMNKSNEK